MMMTNDNGEPCSGLYVLRRNVKLLFRKAREIPPRLEEELLAVCRENNVIRRCMLMDVKIPDNGKSGLLLAICLDNPYSNFEDITKKYQNVFKRHPKQGEQTLMVIATDEEYKGYEFYVRGV